MGNPQHLAKLRDGIQAWNKWKSTAKANIDLSACDLRKENLGGADLSDLNLSHAVLHSADLGKASLNGSNLQGAILVWADLTGTDLQGANLSHANLQGANLSFADMYSATVVHANLSEANLQHCLFGNTILGDTNMTNSKGLETCRHRGRSLIDLATIAKSWPLPDVFLRGCGLPENYITYLPSLLNQPIQFYSCFISYSTQDQPFADRLHADLQNAGVRCWFAPHDMASGQKIHEQIDEAIRLHDKLLLILSPHSMHSEWVKTEIAKARKRELTEKRRMLFPVALAPFETIRSWECFDADTGKDSAREIREYFIPDFSTWKTNHDAYKSAFDRLLRSLQPKSDSATAKR